MRLDMAHGLLILIIVVLALMVGYDLLSEIILYGREERLENAIVIAPVGSPYENEAAYLCDGTDDQVEINAALEALPESGGQVYLVEGTYHCSDSIRPGANAVLTGEGADLTVLQFSGSASVALTRGDNVTLSSFGVTGSGRVYISTSHNLVEDVAVTGVDDSYIASFMVYAYDEVIEDVAFVNCEAVDGDRWGFVHDGGGTTHRVRDITYTDCRAVNCGRYAQYYGEDQEHTEAWDVGFDVAESLQSAENITYIDCSASGCWESGFHVEPDTVLRSIRFIGCEARDNGQKQKSGGGTADFGAGFLINEETTLERCLSADNLVGFDCSAADGSVLVECKDERSEKGFRIHSIGEKGLTLRSCQTEATEYPVYIWTGTTRNVLIEGMTIHSATPHPSPAITIDALAKDPAEILITGSRIEGYALGVKNEAEIRGQVRVENLIIGEATEDCIGCAGTSIPLFPEAGGL
ncbi:hypothetical protein J2129_000053 [Methanofollis sp. W23]|uniref:glycosyl hydrolase family 28-related protein n=1 Tax=Methanofollis sp. W23 TaxID=2817849 RepID=UPI001AE41376|nr:glycosyl hydrolase family 28-related protein [Methanofollis sp. W23]MBP2144599.1 hypothetical protein [Methanofollis sp. W23]